MTTMPHGMTTTPQLLQGYSEVSLCHPAAATAATHDTVSSSTSKAVTLQHLKHLATQEVVTPVKPQATLLLTPRSTSSSHPATPLRPQATLPRLGLEDILLQIQVIHLMVVVGTLFLLLLGFPTSSNRGDIPRRINSRRVVIRLLEVATLRDLLLLDIHNKVGGSSRRMSSQAKMQYT